MTVEPLTRTQCATRFGVSARFGKYSSMHFAFGKYSMHFGRYSWIACRCTAQGARHMHGIMVSPARRLRRRI